MSMEEDKLSARTMHTECIEIENELNRTLKKKNFSIQHVERGRERLRVNYEKILFLDYEFANSKDVEMTLWKSCFYRVIEDFRTKIRGWQAQQQPSEKTELRKVCTQFRKFLEAACAFYHSLIHKFRTTFNLKLDGPIPVADRAQVAFRPYVSCHRCMIYLGDLMRYHRDLLQDDTARNSWTQASSYYNRALTLWPENGHPHNQLAVLCTYTEDDFMTIYYYFRSLEVQIPFTTALENLKALFEKILSKTNTKPQSRSRLKLTPSKEFLQNFVKLHAMLWTRTALENFDALKNSVLLGLEQLLLNEQIKEVVLIQIFVSNISHLNLIAKHQEKANSAKALALATSLTLDCFSRVVSQSLLSYASMQESSPKRETPNNHYTSISVFCSWLLSHPEYLRRPEGNYQAWMRLREMMAETANQVLVTTNPVAVEGKSDESNSKSPLAEDIELQGFLPLADAISEVDFSLDKLHEGPASDHRRRSRIIQFALVASDNDLAPNNERFLYYNDVDTRFSTTPQKVSSGLKSSVNTRINGTVHPGVDSTSNRNIDEILGEEESDDPQENNDREESNDDADDLGDVMLFRPGPRKDDNAESSGGDSEPEFGEKPSGVKDDALSYENNPLFNPPRNRSVSPAVPDSKQVFPSTTKPTVRTASPPFTSDTSPISFPPSSSTSTLPSGFTPSTPFSTATEFRTPFGAPGDTRPEPTRNAVGSSSFASIWGPDSNSIFSSGVLYDAPIPKDSKRIKNHVSAPIGSGRSVSNSAWPSTGNQGSVQHSSANLGFPNGLVFPEEDDFSPPPGLGVPASNSATALSTASHHSLGYPPPFTNGSNGNSEFFPLFYPSGSQLSNGNSANMGMWGAPHLSRNGQNETLAGAFNRPIGSSMPPFLFGGLTNAHLVPANSYVQKDG